MVAVSKGTHHRVPETSARMLRIEEETRIRERGGEEGGTNSRSAGGSKDQAAQVGGALVAQGTGGVDECADTIRLQRRTDEGGAPGEGGTGCLSRAEKLLFGVGSLGALVCLAEERGEHGQLGRVVEDGAEGDSRGLNSGEIFVENVSFLGRKSLLWEWCFVAGVKARSIALLPALQADFLFQSRKCEQVLRTLRLDDIKDLAGTGSSN